jgi:hypothetical protein
MDQKIQLLHPDGRKAVSIDQAKYDLLKKAIMNSLKTNGESSYSEILQLITENFKENKINFEGSLEWYLEWVKLDLEARKDIRRVSKKSPVKYILT